MSQGDFASSVRRGAESNSCSTPAVFLTGYRFQNLVYDSPISSFPNIIFLDAREGISDSAAYLARRFPAAVMADSTTLPGQPAMESRGAQHNRGGTIPA